MLSPYEVAQKYELWLYEHSSRFRMPLQCCGTFDSVLDACRFGRLVRAFLRDRRKWSDEFDRLAWGDRSDLDGMTDFLTRLCGIDPHAVMLTVRPYPAPGGDNVLPEESVASDGWRTDAGHKNPASPHDPFAEDGEEEELEPTTLSAPDITYESSKALINVYFHDSLTEDDRVLVLRYLDAVYRELGGNGLKVLESRERSS